jgi:hypothetical protein
MDGFQVLEQKISYLVSKVKELKEKNDTLQLDIDALRKESRDVKMENAKFLEENVQLNLKLEILERDALRGNDQINELNEERSLTKMAVDDLLERLKIIDSLVEHQ